MRPRVWCCGVGVVLALLSEARAQGYLAFDYPRRLDARGFVITATADGQGQPTTLTAAASAVGACTAIRESGSADTYCVQLGCFPPGRYQFAVQAQVGDKLSPPASLECQVDAQCRCVQRGGSAPVGGLPGDTGSGAPTPPGNPAGTTPPYTPPQPPTFAQVPVAPPPPAPAPS